MDQATTAGSVNLRREVTPVVVWAVTLIVLSIPIVGLPISLYWASGKRANQERANLCKAHLLLWLALAVAAVVGTLLNTA